MLEKFPDEKLEEINNLKKTLYDSQDGRLLDSYKNGQEVDRLRLLKAELSALIEKYITGWKRDLPGNTDSTIDFNVEEMELLRKAAPSAIDLRGEFESVKDQDSLNSCTACAAIDLLEFFEKRSSEENLKFSVLFLYKMARKLIKRPTANTSFLKQAVETRDDGASLRITLKAMARLGLVPEIKWPYKIENVDAEPSEECYGIAEHSRNTEKYYPLIYFRLDAPEITQEDLLTQVKNCLAVGFPSVFGFTVFDSIVQADINGGMIPLPTDADSSIGGHAMLAVGYDDNLKILNTNPGAQETKGALLVKNSWGTSWGQQGYGWLPYDYIIEGLTVDWWSLFKEQWKTSGKFGITDLQGNSLTGSQGENLGIPRIKHKP